MSLLDRADAEVHRQGIRALFDLVAPRYDLMNDLMSGGIHRLWKRRLAALAGSPNGRAVDLAGGTGDVARLLARRGWPVTVCDPSVGMMRQGRGRALPDGWVAGTGEALPFADGSLALVTAAFGVRNMTDRAAALAEVARVLRPGGRFLCLEFSTPVRLVAPAYRLYSDHVIPLLGALVAGRREAYRYLVDSIRAFPDQEGFKRMMETAGFTEVRYTNLSFGIAAIHDGKRAP